MTITGTTRVAAVWGHPVKHSASPAMHNAAFAALGLDCVYVAFEVAPDRIAEAVAGIRALDLLGVNVTVPLKERVIPHLDGVSERARAIGAVNTIVPRDGRLWGDSTDGPGFVAALESAGVRVEDGRFVVLGAGGSARAVVYALASMGANVVIANRGRERAEALAEDFASLSGTITVTGFTEDDLRVALREETTALVNTTSIGLHPSEGEMPPVPIDALRPSLFVADLIYKPFTTRLLAAASERGCRTQNGVEMLVRQGAIAFRHWTDREPPADIMRDAVLGTLGRKIAVGPGT